MNTYKESGISVSFTKKETERPDSCCGFWRGYMKYFYKERRIRL